MRLTIELCEACTAAVKQVLARDDPPTVSISVPPTVPGPTEPIITPAEAGLLPFTVIQRREWDWAAGGLIHYTAASGSGIGNNGIVVIGFNVPLAARAWSIGSISIAPFPGDLSGCERIISIGPEGDFTQPFPWTRKDVDPSIQFQISGESRFAPCLQPGARYWINIISPGWRQAGRACDFVVQCSVPK